jgi:NADH dehydrogenase FAD-containing subunit
MTRLMVVGGGYSGVVAAKLAAKWTDATVILINDNDRFVERVRLHQLVAGQTLRDLPLRDLLAGTGVELVVDRVKAIDPEAKQLHLALEKEPVSYDILVYAVGSLADLDSVPGAAEHAYSVATYDQATRLRDHLVDARSVTVVGGGLTGIETAAELAESRPDLKVRLVTNGVLGETLSRRGQRHLRRTLSRLGVEVRENARVTEVRADGVVLADDHHLPADTVIWTAGFRVPTLARDAGLAVDHRGRMVVDETLRSVSHPDVYGVGDAAAIRRPDGLELRMACATGMPTAQQAMRALADRLAGRTPRPVRFRYAFQCISLGRRDGLIQFVRFDDSPREVVLTGRLAAVYKEAIVRGTVLVERRPTLPAGW